MSVSYVVAKKPEVRIQEPSICAGTLEVCQPVKFPQRRKEISFEVQQRNWEKFSGFNVGAQSVLVRSIPSEIERSPTEQLLPKLTPWERWKLPVPPYAPPQRPFEPGEIVPLQSYDQNTTISYGIPPSVPLPTPSPSEKWEVKEVKVKVGLPGTGVEVVVTPKKDD
ncbi:MAG: hypothetical protein A3I05_00595 [Deltaproteobacteria bacterium RIFCSPLOWO2_02_FULL_44_10]|nr:MAG: hypothetical protein A3C46_09685 [Deltaproteobacteria bacterium RIFCSPHIGHO2_02_FULL_44_16]OGQ45190.1 MAG: hypothetical protein A3I05_00595 [Deltaproteobacteria bacterium RIFCSPLOWO2_02_FULL_44_10]